MCVYIYVCVCVYIYKIYVFMWKVDLWYDAVLTILRIGQRPFLRISIALHMYVFCCDQQADELGKFLDFHYSCYQLWVFCVSLS